MDDVDYIIDELEHLLGKVCLGSELEALALMDILVRLAVTLPSGAKLNAASGEDIQVVGRTDAAVVAGALSGMEPTTLKARYDAASALFSTDELQAAHVALRQRLESAGLQVSRW